MFRCLKLGIGVVLISFDNLDIRNNFEILRKLNFLGKTTILLKVFNFLNLNLTLILSVLCPKMRSVLHLLFIFKCV